MDSKDNNEVIINDGSLIIEIDEKSYYCYINKESNKRNADNICISFMI